MKQPTLINTELIAAVRERFQLDWNGVHGAPHWARVRVNGLMLAPLTNAGTDVIELFAFFHDSCRENDYEDPDHGLRAAEFAASMRNRIFYIDDAGFKLLRRACETHSNGQLQADPTVQTCWDADRLDLWRVQITPDPKRLATTAARSSQLYNLAKRRSRQWLLNAR